MVGVDIGGTFTDLMLHDTDTGAVSVHKVRSTPDDPGEALIRGIRELCEQSGVPASALDAVYHGTTVATNAVLQHRGAVAGMMLRPGVEKPRQEMAREFRARLDLRVGRMAEVGAAADGALGGGGIGAEGRGVGVGSRAGRSDGGVGGGSGVLSWD